MNSFSFFRWLNLLSLDVVLIALAWQEVFARAAFVTLRWEERTFLAISIWIVYILDHWLDSMADAVSSAGFFSNKAPRHHYVRSHRFVLGSLLVLASLANVWLLWHLGLRLLIAGMGLVVITLSYLVINTFFLRRGRWFKGREIIISIIFSVGCSLVGLVQGDRPWLLLPWIMAFALVALINCTLIARMERIDFFRNSTSDANCGVAPVLASSSINYTLSRCAPEAPGTASPAASSTRGPLITATMVRDLVPQTRMGGIFDLSNAIAKRDLPLSLTTLKQLLRQGESAMGILLAAILPTVRNLLLAKSLLTKHRLRPPEKPQFFASVLQKLPATETAHLPRKKDGSLNAYGLGISAVNANKFEESQLVQGFLACRDTNQQLLRSQGGEAMLLTQLVIRLVAPTNII